MPHLVCTMHNESSGHDWCLIPLISFICSSRLDGAVFQGQWIKHPREAKKCTFIMGLGTATGSFPVSPGQRKRDWAYPAGLLQCRQCHKVIILMYVLPFAEHVLTIPIKLQVRLIAYMLSVTWCGLTLAENWRVFICFHWYIGLEIRTSLAVFEHRMSIFDRLLCLALSQNNRWLCKPVTQKEDMSCIG